MVVIMRLIRDSRTHFVYGTYQSREEAERIVKILQATTDAWEFYTK